MSITLSIIKKFLESTVYLPVYKTMENKSSPDFELQVS